MRKLFLPFVLLLLLINCGEVLEENISNKRINILAPADSALLASDTVTFWWNHIDGATDYEFHLVSPSFSNVNRVWVDTITKENLLTFVLAEGSYEWEIRALNTGYVSDYFYCSFMIGSSTATADHISEETVSLLTPVDEASINRLSVEFYWEDISDADEYEFWLVSPDFSSINKVWAETFTTENFISYNLEPGGYQWRVRAKNSSSETNYSVRSFQIDTTAVEDISMKTVNLRAPADSITLSAGNINLWWDVVNGASAYEVLVAKPSFEEDEIEELVFDQITGADKLTVSLDSGNYQWSVRAFNHTFSTQPSVRSLFVID